MEQKKLVEIYMERNPNPNSLKFVTDVVLLPNGTVDYPDAVSAQDCELALDLFRFNFVKRVFIAANFVTVTKDNSLEWEEIAPMIRALIKGYLEENKPIFKQAIKVDVISADDPEIIQKIKVLLDEYIRPAVEQDGGAINFKSWDENSGQVTVQLQGSCSGCPSSTITLKSGIENLMKRMIPEVKEVVAESV
jgi:NFU1 iron-sulfur cluster scaffold homolog, mitochondrial